MDLTIYMSLTLTSPLSHHSSAAPPPPAGASGGCRKTSSSILQLCLLLSSLRVLFKGLSCFQLLKTSCFVVSLIQSQTHNKNKEIDVRCWTTAPTLTINSHNQPQSKHNNSKSTAAIITLLLHIGNHALT